MKFSCEKEKLKIGLILVEKTASRTFNSINLSPILIEVMPQKIILKSNNFEVAVEYEIPAKIEKAGSVALPGQLITQFISNLNPNEKNIKIEHLKQTLHVSSEQTSATIKTLPTDNYPKIKKLKESDPAVKIFTLDAADLISGIKSVSYAASLSDIKPEISSIYVYQDNNELFFVATDSFRLAEKRLKIDKNNSNNLSALIPAKNSQEIVRIFEKTIGPLEVMISGNQLALKSDNTYFTTRLIEGVFPDYKQIIPKGFSTEVTVSRESLLASLRITNVFTNRFSQVGLKVIPNENLFEISTANQEVGEVVTRLSGQLSGEEVSNQFNSRFLLDCLQATQSSEVSLAFAGENKPLLLRPVGDNSFFYLVMPLYRT